MGDAWTADYLKITGELDVDLRSNIAAEARAKIVYERLINFCRDSGTKDALQFLMTREITHMRAFTLALESMGKPPCSIDADSGRTVLFSFPRNMQNVPFPDTFADVWRMVPTVNDVKLTGPDGQTPWPRGPNPSGGYQLDARFATLQDQAQGALTNHAQVRFAVPQEFLDDLHSFQRVLFTNNRVRALADAIDDGVTPLPDPDPALNALERRGKTVFQRACAQCHGGPAQSLTQADVVFRYHDIFTECPRPVDTVTPPRFAFGFSGSESAKLFSGRRLRTLAAAATPPSLRRSRRDRAVVGHESINGSSSTTSGGLTVKLKRSDRAECSGSRLKFS
jgi:hypothetical protein